MSGASQLASFVPTWQTTDMYRLIIYMYCLYSSDVYCLNSPISDASQLARFAPTWQITNLYCLTKHMYCLKLPSCTAELTCERRQPAR